MHGSYEAVRERAHLLPACDLHSGPGMCGCALQRGVGVSESPVRAAAGALLYLPVDGIGRPPSPTFSLDPEHNLLQLGFFGGGLAAAVSLEKVFLLDPVCHRALLRLTVGGRLLPGPVRDPVIHTGGLLDPGVVAPLGDGPGLEILLVLGFTVKRRFRFVILVLGFAAGFGPHVPSLEVLAHHRVAHALLGDASPRRACRCPGAGLRARRLRFYGDPCLSRRLQLDVLHLGDIRVLGEDQRNRDVRLVQLVPEAGHAARPADAGPGHGEGSRYEAPLERTGNASSPGSARCWEDASGLSEGSSNNPSEFSWDPRMRVRVWRPPSGYITSLHGKNNPARCSASQRHQRGASSEKESSF